MTADGADAGRVVVLDVVGLQPRHVDPETTPALAELLDERTTTDLRPPFPALTVPAQTALAAGEPPGMSGDVASGEYDRETDSVAFWERDRGDRTRLWETASEQAGLTTGALFFQHLIGTTADVAVTPSPIEDEDNQLLEMNCWTNPDGLYDGLREDLGHFPLHRYWGPGADAESSRWILDAAERSVARFDSDLLWVYVPHLDYAGLRSGPGSREMQSALETVDGLLGGFLDALRADERWAETAVVVVSEYGFHDVDTPVCPSRALRRAGLLATDDDGEVSLERSEAFAMVDHQVAHVYADGTREVEDALADLEGIDAVLDEAEKQRRGLDHPAAGDVVLVSEQNAWFQYYWWKDDDEAPSYATDMDIHAKPGFDPCELFAGESGLVPLDPSKVGGSHGRVDEDAYGAFGLGGPAAPTEQLDGPVDATSVAPTVADLLGIGGQVETAVGEAPRPRK